MFLFVIGLMCGVFLVQEVPSIPKLRPYLDRLWQKLNGSPLNSAGPPADSSSESESEKEKESSSKKD
jgi:hypothetical protein